MEDEQHEKLERRVPVKGFSRHVSVPADEGIRVEKVIIIERPVEEVYSFWSKFENLPRFMRHIESVNVIDDLHSHWRVRTLTGKIVEWDAEIIECRENEMISWRSTPGSKLENAGSVWFKPIPGQSGTTVRLVYKYVPPAGKAAALIAKAFRSDADTETEEDLNRLKSLLETGQEPEDSFTPKWSERVAGLSRRSCEAADSYVRANSWPFVVSAAGVGLLVGLLLGRSHSRTKSKHRRRNHFFDFL